MTAARQTQASGQALPLFAILIPGMLALMALGLDAAQIFLERRDAQSAADLAAVAGAKQLPDSDANANNEAEAVGIANGYSAAEVKPNAEYGSPAQIEVVIDTEVDTFFMNILSFFGGGSFDKVAVSGRAVAQQDPGGESEGTYALFSLQPCGSKEDFKAIEWSGNENTIEGSVHSSSGLTLSGNQNVIEEEFSLTCVAKNGTPTNLRITDKFPYNEGGTNPAILPNGDAVVPDCTGSEAPGQACRKVVPIPDIPFYNETNGTIDNAAITAACTRTVSGDVTPSKVSTPGCYRSTSKVVIKSGTYGPVTIIAPEFDIGDSNVRMETPFLDNILLYATTSTEGKGIVYSGNNGQFGSPSTPALLYSPRASSMVSFAGEGNTVYGALVGYYIKFNGNKSRLVGSFGSSDASPPVVAIIE